MENLTYKRSAWLLILTGILFTVLTLSSCGNESPTNCSFEGIGTLEGYLLSSGQGVSAEIKARTLDGSNVLRVYHSTVSDSTGWYRLDLPTGLYQLEVEDDALSVTSSDNRDVIRVMPRVFRFDLERSRAEIRVGMPDEFEGRELSLWLHGPDHGRGRQRAKVQDGWMQFVFPVLPPGSFSMELNIQGLNSRFYLPGTRDPLAADSLTVDTDRITTYEVDFGDTYASVSGSITGSWQDVQGWQMMVEAYSVDLKILGATHCSVDGSFTCEFFIPQEVRLMSNFRGIEQWLGVESIGDQGVFDLQPGDRITGVTLVESGFQVRLDGPGNLAFHRPTVTVFDEAGNEHKPEVHQDNPFPVGNLRPGRYYLHVDGFCNGEIWTPQWYGGAETMADAIPIDLVEGESQHLVMNLVEGDRIEGEILTWDGLRPDRFNCGLYGSDGEPLCSDNYPWQRFENGIFHFSGLPNGEYFLATQAYLHDFWWYPGTGNFEEAIPIVIENHVSVTGLSWLLPKPWKAAGP